MPASGHHWAIVSVGRAHPHSLKKRGCLALAASFGDAEGPLVQSKQRRHLELGSECDVGIPP